MADRVLGALIVFSSLAFAGDQSKAVERQVDAARRQTDKALRTKFSGDFFLTPWLAGEAAAPGAKPACEKMQAEQLQALISKIPSETLAPGLLDALIEQESAGRPCAVSVKGAVGLMQIMPDVISDMNVDDPFDPEQNLRAGIQYLVQLTAKYRGDLRKILAAYNAGPARVDAAGGVPDIPETQNYVKSILAKIERK